MKLTSNMMRRLRRLIRTITMKMCGKVVGARNGYITTYMPKPFSRHKWFRNAYSPKPLEQERIAKPVLRRRRKERLLVRFGAKLHRGQLAHGRKMCAILDSWPNSFKRLVQATRRQCILLGRTRTVRRLFVCQTSAEERTLPDAKSAAQTEQETRTCSLQCFWRRVWMASRTGLTQVTQWS